MDDLDPREVWRRTAVGVGGMIAVLLWMVLALRWK